MKKHNSEDYLKAVRDLLRENMVDYLHDLFCNEQTGFDMAEQLIIRLYNQAHKDYFARFDKELRFDGSKKTGWDGLDEPIYRFIEDYTIYKFIVKPLLEIKKDARKKRELGGRKMDILYIYEKRALPEWRKQCEVVQGMWMEKEAQRTKSGLQEDKVEQSLVSRANSGDFEARKQLEPNIKR